MGESPQVSVIIAAYNAGRTIGETLRSLTEQSFTDFEVLVVNDGSTDHTAETVRAFDGGGVSIELIEQANAGPAAARNLGFSRARGQWFAIIDADDVALPWRLQHSMALVEHFPEVGLISGASILTTDPVPKMGSVDLSQARVVELLQFAVDNPIATSASMIRAAVVRDIGGFDPTFRRGEDYDLWMRIAAKYQVIKYEVPLVRYRLRENSLSMDHAKYLPEARRLLQKAFGPGGVLSQHRDYYHVATAHQYDQLSWMAFQGGYRLTAVRLLIESMANGILGKLKTGAELPERQVASLVRYLVGKREEMAPNA